MPKKLFSNNSQSNVLSILKGEANELLIERINKGYLLLHVNINSHDELMEEKKKYFLWHKSNIHLLNKIFKESKMADEYSPKNEVYYFSNASLVDEIKNHSEVIKNNIERLISIVERLAIFRESKMEDDS